MKKLCFTAFIAGLVVPVAAIAQTFGQYTTAAIASEGEGGIFVRGGDEAVRTGIMARFELTNRSDLGLQIGFDREYRENSFGAGLDFKFYLISAVSDFPLDLAIDLSLGHLRSGNYSRNILGIGLLVSGELRSVSSLEPYAFITVLNTYFPKKASCHEEHPSQWPCSEDDWKSDTETVLRGGAKYALTEEYQLLAEVELGDEITFGAALNIIF